MEGGAVEHNFERDPPSDHPCQVWFNLVQQFQRRRFKCDLLSNYSKTCVNRSPLGPRFTAGIDSGLVYSVSTL